MTTMLKQTFSVLVLSVISLYGGGDYTVVDTEPEAIADHSARPFYIGGGLTSALFHACKKAGCTYEDRTYGGLLRVGYDFSDYLGIEARALRTFWGKGPFGGVPLQHVGLFGKAQYPAGEDLNLYGLLGYGYTQNLGNGARLNYFDHDHGFSAGLGAEYTFAHRDEEGKRSKKWTVFVDYQRLLIRSDVPDMDVVSLGLRYDF